MRRSVVPACVALVVVLTGCAAGSGAQPSPTASSTATPVPTAMRTPTPTATASSPEPEPEASAVSDSCDTVLTDEEYASLEEDGLALNPDIYVLDDTMQSVLDAGFGCYWTRSGGDVRVWYAQASQNDDTWASEEQRLIDDGWTHTDVPVEGVLQAPSDHDPNYLPVVAHSDGITYYASYPEFLGSVTALRD